MAQQGRFLPPPLARACLLQAGLCLVPFHLAALFSIKLKMCIFKKPNLMYEQKIQIPQP